MNFALYAWILDAASLKILYIGLTMQCANAMRLIPKSDVQGTVVVVALGIIFNNPDCFNLYLGSKCLITAVKGIDK